MAFEETIVAISTPRGSGAVGMVRLSGPEAVDIARAVFRSSPGIGHCPRHVHYGQVVSRGQIVDQGLAWFLKGPHSFTGEDTVEITSHGNPLILENIVTAAVEAGAVAARPGEFTRRAFLNGKLDLLQAEAVVDLIQAGNAHALDTAYGHLKGKLSGRIEAVKGLVIEALTQIEVGLDFSDDDVESASAEGIRKLLGSAGDQLDGLIDTFAASRLRLDGRLVAIIGRPNVGKSALFNVLLGEERAIVSDEPGTTRDLVEVRVRWSGEQLRLVDTAGLRPAAGVEKEGVRRARATAEAADVVVGVFDASEQWTEEDNAVLQAVSARADGIAVLNKTDLPRKIVVPEIAGASIFLEVSAVKGDGLSKLRDRIVDANAAQPTVAGVELARQRHRDGLAETAVRLQEALSGLDHGLPPECWAVELHEALNTLGELLGLDVSDAVLDSIFSEFCIGK